MKPAMALAVSASSGVAIYRQIVDQVRAQIAGGRLASGDFLASVRQVAESLDVNPMTVSKAYSILERDGVVELARGQGMRVLGASNGKVRREVLQPLLKQVAATARQLSMSSSEVMTMLKPMLEEQ